MASAASRAPPREGGRTRGGREGNLPPFAHFIGGSCGNDIRKSNPIRLSPFLSLSPPLPPSLLPRGRVFSSYFHTRAFGALVARCYVPDRIPHSVLTLAAIRVNRHASFALHSLRLKFRTDNLPTISIARHGGGRRCTGRTRSLINKHRRVYPTRSLSARAGKKRARECEWTTKAEHRASAFTPVCTLNYRSHLEKRVHTHVYVRCTYVRTYTHTYIHTYVRIARHRRLRRRRRHRPSSLRAATHRDCNFKRPWRAVIFYDTRYAGNAARSCAAASAAGMSLLLASRYSARRPDKNPWWTAEGNKSRRNRKHDDRGRPRGL